MFTRSIIVKTILTLCAASSAVFCLSKSELAPAAAAFAPGENDYTVDAVHSSVNFRVKHMGVSYSYGRFNSISGSLTFDEKAPEKGSILIEVKAESIDTNSEGRDKHLKSPDFFNVKQFPTITFKSTSVKKAGEKMYEVTGDFTLHGVTKPVTFKAEHVGSGKGRDGGRLCGFDALARIKRSDFDMKYSLSALGDEVDLHIGIEAVQADKK
ncbi:MAG: YceI family protein [Planctomycetota bacterium]